MPAIDQLERLLYILPAASGEDGIALAELARTLGVDQRTVLADLEQATARAYYHPAASVDPFTILIDGDRVHVQSMGEFERPVRLNARETLALGLGLRALAADESEPRRSEMVAFAERIERELSAPEVDLQPRVHGIRERIARPPAERPTEPMQLEIELGDDDIRGVIADAIRDQRVCDLRYLKAGSSEAEQRRVAPQQLIYGNGRWYVAAYDLERQAARLFRLDRVLGVQVDDQLDLGAVPPLSDRFTQPQQLYEADRDAEAEVTVRYTPRVARWIVERAPTEPVPDGSVRVRHQVADPRWLVRHVLQYGGDAIVETPAYRVLVADAAERLAG